MCIYFSSILIDYKFKIENIIFYAADDDDDDEKEKINI